MSIDAKLFKACTHIVDKKHYEPELCPRCAGEGYYFDIHFGRDGLLVTCTGSIKLQQEMIKILLEEKGDNKFFPDWGSTIGNMVGTKNLNMTKSKIEMVLRETLNHLQTVQVNEFLRYDNITKNELLNAIEYLEIEELGKTGYKITVALTNGTDEILMQTVAL